MLNVLYTRMTGWLSVQHLERRIALIALLFTLPSLAVGLQADDYVLREQVMKDGPFAAYLFTPLGSQASHERSVEQRTAGHVPWWVVEPMRMSFFRPLSSLSLWLGFAHGAPPWWMHLENCAIYTAIAWLAAMIYRQLGLSGAGLGWAALFFGLDMGFATSVGWIASRNTLLATCFGFACILLHDRARRAGRPALLGLACACFALSLLSSELGLCTLGFVSAHALAVDRAPALRRMVAMLPYAALAGVYLAHFIGAGYGVSESEIHRDIVGAPGATLLAWIESIPVWLATTATLPVATLQLIVPDARLPIFVLSVIILSVVLPLLAASSREQPTARFFGAGALLSLVPLATVFPQERLRFFVALGVYGVVGPWVVRDFDAGERVRRIAARAVWRIHGVWLPLFFVPALFSIGSAFAGGGANALDRVVPRSAAPITVVLNPPTWYVPWHQAAMRACRGEPRPPVFTLYAGTQSLELERPDVRTLDVHAARSWFTTPFERSIRDVTRSPFRVGDRVALAHLAVEVREVDAGGAPTRARFTFDRPLDDPGLTFRYWHRSKIATWTPPPVGSRSRLPASTIF